MRQYVRVHIVFFPSLLAKNFIARLKLTKAEQYDEIYEQMVREMVACNFCAMNYNLTAWGRKPKA